MKWQFAYAFLCGHLVTMASSCFLSERPVLGCLGLVLAIACYACYLVDHHVPR